MILIYLILEHDQFSPTDAYYFPESIIPISRMSEPKNFTGTTEPRGRTVLAAELPSDPGQPEWELSDEELGRRLNRLAEAGRAACYRADSRRGHPPAQPRLSRLHARLRVAPGDA